MAKKLFFSKMCVFFSVILDNLNLISINYYKNVEKGCMSLNMTTNCFFPSEITDMMKDLRWPTPDQQCNDGCFVMLYRITYDLVEKISLH